MPQRRPHRKSRYGCDQCRKRRVKCDENPPRCASCNSRNEECVWSRLPPRKTNGSDSTTHATVSSNSSNGLLDVGDHEGFGASRSGSELPVDAQSKPSVRLRELELMHTWCTRTSVSAGPRFQRLFREYIGREALSHDYLMSALLALSSFHLASDAILDGRPIAPQYISAGLQYQNEALSGLRQVLATMNQDNCSPILFTAVLLMCCAIVSPLLPVSPKDSHQSTSEAMLPLIDHMKAVESIKELGQPWLVNTSIRDYLDEEVEIEEATRSLNLDELRRLNDEFTPPDKRDIYDKAITELDKASRKDDEVLPWLVDSGYRFLDELRREEGMALAIYMHWGTFLDQLQHFWWARFSGKRLVDEVSAILRLRGPEFQPIIRWSRKQVGLSDESELQTNDSEAALANPFAGPFWNAIRRSRPHADETFKND